MKRFFTIFFTLMMLFTLAACSPQENADSQDPVVNPTNLTFSLTNETENPDVEGFTTIEDDPFIAEEGSTVLEATELYCMSHDMTITIETNGSYVTKINGFAQGDYSDTTGWIFTVSGELPDVSAGEMTIEECDKIVWSFIDFSTYAW